MCSGRTRELRGVAKGLVILNLAPFGGVCAVVVWYVEKDTLFCVKSGEKEEVES